MLFSRREMKAHVGANFVFCPLLTVFIILLFYKYNSLHLGQQVGPMCVLVEGDEGSNRGQFCFLSIINCLYYFVIL